MSCVVVYTSRVTDGHYAPIMLVSFLIRRLTILPEVVDLLLSL
jgi:hypothetical protein